MKFLGLLCIIRHLTSHSGSQYQFIMVSRDVIEIIDWVVPRVRR